MIALGALVFGVATVWFFFWRTNQIDRILSHKNRQLVAVFSIIFIVLALLMSIENVISDDMDKANAWSHLYGLFSQTVGAYSYNDDNSNPKQQIFYIIVSLTGAVLFSGAFVATITNSLLRRIDDSEKGMARYRNLRNHDIVIGANELLPSVVLYLTSTEVRKDAARKGFFERLLLKPSKLFASKKILIVTHKDTDEVQAQLAKMDLNHSGKIIIYRDDISASKYLEDICLNRCNRVVIIGDRDVESGDTDNVATLKRIHNQAKRYYKESERGRKETQCFVSYYNDNMVLNFCCNPDNRDAAFHIYPFNFHSLWADNIWGYGQLDADIKKREKGNEFKPLRPVDADMGKRVNGKEFFKPLRPVDDGEEYSLHIVILGFSVMAVELVKTAVKVAHFSNFNEKNNKGKTLITVITNNKARVNRFNVLYGTLDKLPDIDLEFKDHDVNSKECLDLLASYAETEARKMYIAICSDNMNDNIALANNMPCAIYSHSIPVLVYQDEFQEAVECILRKHLREGNNIKVFGAYNSNVNLKATFSKAISLKYIYSQIKNQCKDSTPEEFYLNLKEGNSVFSIMPENARTEWFKEHFDNVRRRWLAIANAMSNMTASAKYRIVEKNDRYPDIDIARFLKTMSPVMQRQYIAWNIIAGYTPEDIAKPNDWLLRKVKTLHTLEILKSKEKEEVEIKERIEEIEKECMAVLFWLYENNCMLELYEE